MLPLGFLRFRRLWAGAMTQRRLELLGRSTNSPDASVHATAPSPERFGRKLAFVKEENDPQRWDERIAPV